MKRDIWCISPRDAIVPVSGSRIEDAPVFEGCSTALLMAEAISGLRANTVIIGYIPGSLSKFSFIAIMTSEKNSNFIQAYYRSNIDLISSMIFKSNYAPEAINKQLLRDNPSYEIQKEDPTTWKYYMNLAGEYHPLDEEMYVTSLDTREVILFSKENLIRHTATKEAYQMGSRDYLTLLKQYPLQEGLIRGILILVIKNPP